MVRNIPVALTIGGFSITDKMNVIVDNRFDNENKKKFNGKKGGKRL